MSAYVPKVIELLKAHKYVQFSASWCPDCAYANSVWKKLGIDDKIYVFDIGSMPTAEQQQWRAAFMQATGSRNLPTIYVNGRIWGTESQLHSYENSGTLKQELNKIGLI